MLATLDATEERLTDQPGLVYPYRSRDGLEGEFTDEPHDLMIPHTLVLEPGLKIFKIYNGNWYWGRPTMSELHVDLRGVFKKIRPDFDLAAPGLREAWERGDRDQFMVDTLEEPIRYREGKSIDVKR